MHKDSKIWVKHHDESDWLPIPGELSRERAEAKAGQWQQGNPNRQYQVLPIGEHPTHSQGVHA